jgi:4,5-DOPA dioxygenase extradiol
MNRRAFLQLVASAGAIDSFACGRTKAQERSMSTMEQKTNRTPAIFLAHGSPFLLDDAAWVAELAAWGKALPRPKAILVVSAHWVDAPVTLGATETVPLTYDFYGFPGRYYQVKYPAPGAPDLAARVRSLVGETRDEPKRGLDHGAYVPFVAMYPQADVPVLQISIPTMDPASLVALGRKLAPLRDEGVLIVGSGFLTHNMHALDFEGARGVPAWAREFDEWNATAIAKRDVDALVHYRQRAPGVASALPTHEHYVPMLVALGASVDSPEATTFPVTGFTYGSFTKRSVQFG